MRHIIKQLSNNMWINTFYFYQNIFYNLLNSKRFDFTQHDLHLSRILKRSSTSLKTCLRSPHSYGACVCWWKTGSIPFIFNKTTWGPAAVVVATAIAAEISSDWSWDWQLFDCCRLHHAVATNHVVYMKSTVIKPSLYNPACFCCIVRCGVNKPYP